MGKFRSGKMTFIIAGVLLAAAGIIIAIKLFLGTDAREFYFKAESRNFEKYSQWINENYTSFREKQMPYTETAYRRRKEFTVELKSGGNLFGLKDADRLFDLINRSKLVVDTKRQPQEDRTISKLALLIEKAPFIDAEVFSKAGTLYLTVPLLLPDKYFSAKLDKIDEVYDKFSIPIRPKRLINETDIAQTLKFEASTFDEAAKKLGAVFTKLISEDAVRYGQDRELTISGQTVKGREVLVSLDEPSATALLGQLGAFIATDESLLSYTYGNFTDISMMLEDAGLFRLFEFLNQSGTVVFNENGRDLVNSLNVRKDLESARKYLKETISGYVLEDGLEMTVVIDKAGNILDRKLTLDLTAPEGSKSCKLFINTGSSSTVFDDFRNRFIKITVEEPGASINANTSGKTIELQVVSVFAKPEGTDTQGNIDISYAVAEQGVSKFGTDISLDISGKTDNLTLKRNNAVKYKVKIYGEAGEDKLEGELSSVSWENKKLNTSNSTVKFSVHANLPTFGIDAMSAVINVAGEDRLGIEPFTLPEVPQSDVADLNAATDKDLDRIEMEMMASFGTFYITNKPVFDAILGQ